MTYLQHPVIEDRPVRIAVIGAGWIGAFHAGSIALRIPNARLEAIADPVLPAVEALASRLGVTKISTDVADVLADPDVDAVLIATPLRFHSELIAAAAKAGKDVFCEAADGLSPNSTPPLKRRRVPASCSVSVSTAATPTISPRPGS